MLHVKLVTRVKNRNPNKFWMGARFRSYDALTKNCDRQKNGFKFYYLTNASTFLGLRFPPIQWKW